MLLDPSGSRAHVASGPRHLIDIAFDPIPSNQDASLAVGRQRIVQRKQMREDALDAHLGAVLAPWWDDLDPSAGGEIRYGTFGTSPDRHFAVSWHNVPRFGQSDPSQGYSFQIVLGERAQDIRFQYATVRSGSTGGGRTASIGIQGPVTVLHDAFSFDGSQVVANNQAIRYARSGRRLRVRVDAGGVPVAGTQVAIPDREPVELTAQVPEAVFSELAPGPQLVSFGVEEQLAPGGVGWQR